MDVEGSAKAVARILGLPEDHGPTMKLIRQSLTKKVFPDGSRIVTQNEKTRSVYVIASGSCNVSVKKPLLEQPKVVGTLEEGAVFGELGWLYDTPRAATVVAVGLVQVYALSEHMIQKLQELHPSLKTRMKQRRFLRGVVSNEPTFDPIDDDMVKESLVQSFEERHFKAGECLVRQGETQEDPELYVVESGKVGVYLKKLHSEPARVTSGGPGHTFGELAVVYGGERTASVVAESDVVVWSLPGRLFREKVRKGSRALRQIFEENASIEREGQKFMSTQDFVQTVGSAGEQLDGPHHHSLAYLFHVADTTGSHHISFAEFANLDGVLARSNNELEIMFRLMDRKKKGYLEKRDFLRVVNAITESDNVQLNMKEVDKMFGRKGDDSMLATVTYEEFSELLRSNKMEGALNSLSREAQNMREYWFQAAIHSGGGDDLGQGAEKTTSSPWKNLIAGGIAGAVSRTAVSPLERLKIVFQTQGKPPVFTSIPHGLREIYRIDGFKGYFRGNGSNVIRITPQSALQFFSYEEYKRIYLSFREKSDLQVHERLILGGFAGITSATLTYPLDFIRARLTIPEGAKYKGVVDGLQQVVRNEGPKALFRGLWPTTIGVFPYIGIDFAAYETLKPWAPKDPETGKASTAGMLACGAIAGALGQTIAYPLDLVRRRLQVQGFASTGHNYKGGVWSALKQTVKSDGFGGLYKGLGPNYLKVVPAISITFVVYEKVKTALEL